MNITIQKFGGTSTSSVPTRRMMYSHILEAISHQQKVVAVVSAMGRFDDPYATDTLYSLVGETALDDEELDRLVHIGEDIAALVIKGELFKLGLKVTSVTNQELGIITDDHFQEANIIDLDGSMILEKLQTYDVVICPGFQGHTRDGRITTLGRGGSDLSAIALGVSLKASSVEIYSDVNGIYTADPRVVANPTKIDCISHQAMLALALQGAKVLNHRCVELASRFQVTIHARSSFSHEQGTLVTSDPNADYPEIAGIAGKSGLTLIRLLGFPNTAGANELLKNELERKKVKPSAAVYSEEGDYSLIFDSQQISNAIEALKEVQMQLDFDRIVVRGRVGCVSFVSEKLAEEKRRFYEARKALESFGVNIILDTCENISAVYYIDRNEVSKTQRLLHQYFFN
ncbi:Aspartokinase [Clostridiales bacterium CHKCI006]|nr:Aspartokinase [Clostridiales bacterium CHKCI006]